VARRGSLALQLHLGYTLYETILYVCLGQDLILYVHHVIAVANLVSFLATNRLHFYGCCAGLVEGTNPCLIGLYLFSRIGMKKSMVCTVTGVMLFVGFIVLRVLPLPVIGYWVLKDVRGASSDFEEQLSSRIVYCISIASVWLIWAMSVYWFYRITLGMMKALKQTAQPQAEGDAPAAV